MTGRYWLGSLWFYQSAQHAPNVEMCTAGVQLEAGVGDAQWVDGRSVLVGLDTGESVRKLLICSFLVFLQLFHL